MIVEEDVIARFWQHVKMTETCWLWTGSTRPQGYGHLRLKEKKVAIRAHRLSWMISHNEDPGELFVLHLCNNRACVRPSHLTLGTHADNMLYMSQCGRAYQGKRNHFAKLDGEKAMEIFLAEGSDEVVAKKYGVHPTTVHYIRIKREWKHIHKGSDTEDIVLDRNKYRLRGVKHKVAKLNDEKALEIYNSPLPRKELKELYGVGISTIECIKNKKRWKHIHKVIKKIQDGPKVIS